MFEKEAEEIAKESARKNCPMPFNWNEIDVARQDGYIKGFLEGLHEGQKSKIIPCDRDNEHKWFAYKNLFETKWHIDYSVEGGLPKCNTLKWFENKEAVMYYLVTNKMSYCE